jgi:hypothetical protein
MDPNPQMDLSRAGLVALTLLTLACASKASSGPRPGLPAPEGEEPTPAGPAEPPALQPSAEEPVELHTHGGWTSSLGRISDAAAVLRYRWMPSGDLLFLTEKGWMIHEGGEAVPISGDPLEDALAASERPWQAEKYKWRVSFKLEMTEGSLKCDDVTGTLVGRLEVCLRKSLQRCNVYTFSPDGDLPFPWDESMAPAGLEALDIVAFPSKKKLLVGKGRMLYLFTLVPKPDPKDEVLAKALKGTEPCEQPFVHIDSFEKVETLDDLCSHTLYLSATPYTVDGYGYLFAAEGGVWLGRFDGSADPVLVVPFEDTIKTLSWAPYQEAIAILDAQGVLHMARVTPPGPMTIEVDESQIK